MKKRLDFRTLLWIFVFLLVAASSSWADSGEENQGYRWLIHPKYRGSYSFSEGLWGVQKDGLWGFVDIEDNVVIDFQYLDATPFKRGVAFVKVSSDLWGAIDKNGTMLIEPQFDDYTRYTSLKLEREVFSNLIRFESGEKWGFINLSGDIQIPAIYDSASDFADGFAAVRSGDIKGYIDIENNWVSPEGYFYYSAFRSEEGRWGLKDFRGNVVLEAQYDSIERNEQGLMLVRKNGKWGLMDDTLSFVVEPEYNIHGYGASGVSMPSYSGGLIFLISESELVTAFDTHGNEVFTLPGRYVMSGSFHLLLSVEGYYVMQEGGLGFLVNKKGEVVLPPVFEAPIAPSKEGVVVVSENGLCGLIILNSSSYLAQ